MILLVEDDPNDQMLIQHAFEKLDTPITISAVSKGDQALEAIEDSLSSSKGKDKLPDLILLDLKLPGKSGFDVLGWIRDRDILDNVPVIILSSSNQESDIKKAYELGANSYLVKPVNHGRLIDIVKTIKKYWFDHNVTVDSRGGK